MQKVEIIAGSLSMQIAGIFRSRAIKHTIKIYIYNNKNEFEACRESCPWANNKRNLELSIFSPYYIHNHLI